jgi:hypothetical protein
MAVVLALSLLGALALVRVGVAAVHHARAAAAAEAAALAAAAGGGEPAARQWAAANGARVVSFRSDGATVTVVVELAGSRGAARAAVAAGPNDGLDGGLRAALARAGQLLGHPVPVVTVSPDGLSVDVLGAAGPALRAVAAQAGLCQPDPDGHGARFGVCDPPPLGTKLTTPEQPVRSPDGAPPPRLGPDSEPAEE